MKTDQNDDSQEDKFPVFDLWEDINPGGTTPDDLLARVVDDEADYEDEYFDPDEFE